jgi:hypothetical protein
MINPEPEYVFVFIHPKTNDTAQLPKPVDKVVQNKLFGVQYLITVAKMFFFH